MTSFESTIENTNRALYGTIRRRTFFFKGHTVLLAVQIFLFCMAPMVWGASALSGLVPEGATPDADGFYQISGRTGLPGGDLMAGNEKFKVSANRDGGALFQTTGHWDVPGGTLKGRQIYLRAKGGISFGADMFNVSQLIAAAINKNDFTLGDKLEVGNVKGAITGSPKGDIGSKIYIGTTVEDSSGTIVQTGGLNNGATFKVGNGTITFKGKAEGDTLKLRAGTVTFDEGAEVAGGTVDAGPSGTISGNFTQSGGTVNANEITGTLTQNGNGSATANRIQSLTQNSVGAVANTTEITGVANQSAGTINAGSATATLKVGADSTLGAGNVTAGTISVNDGAGALTLAGNNLSGKTINAGTVTLGGAAGLDYNVGGNISSLQTGANAARDVTANKTGTGTLTLNSINANSLTLQSAATASGNISANTISATTLTQGSGTITTKEITGTVVQNAGIIQAVNAADGLKLNNTITTQNGTLSSNRGNVTIANGSTLSGTVNADTLNGNFTQSAGSTINATTVAGTVMQNGGTIRANNATDGLTLDQAITTQIGILSGDGGNVTVANGSTLSGTVNANTLNGDFTQSAGSTINATTVAGTVTQNGGIIQANNSTDGLTLSQTITTQNGTLSGNGGNVTVANGSTLSDTVNANTLNGDFTQAGRHD